MRRVFFVDKEGNEIFDETVESHAALAMKLIEKNKDLISGDTSENNKKNTKVLQFLQETNGYIMGSAQGEYKRIVFDSRKISEKQRALLRGYYEEGYKLNDTYVEEMRKKREQGPIDNGR